MFIVIILNSFVFVYMAVARQFAARKQWRQAMKKNVLKPVTPAVSAQLSYLANRQLTIFFP